MLWHESSHTRNIIAYSSPTSGSDDQTAQMTAVAEHSVALEA